MLVVGQDSEVSVAWIQECDCIPRECDYILQCVGHVTGVEVDGPRYLGVVLSRPKSVAKLRGYLLGVSDTSPRLKSAGRGAAYT